MIEREVANGGAVSGMDVDGGVFFGGESSDGFIGRECH